MAKDLTALPILSAPGVGPKRAALLASLNIHTIRDALYYIPFRYEDRSALRNIIDIRPGERVTVKGRITLTDRKQIGKRRLHLSEIVVNDGTGLLKGKWFNQPFLQKHFRIGQEVILYGTVKADPYFSQGYELENPEFEVPAEEDGPLLNMPGIVPFYRVTEGISAKQLRKIISGIAETCLGQLSDPIPPEITEKIGLPGLEESLRGLHIPVDANTLASLNEKTSLFHRRLAFDELFMLGLGIAKLRRNKGLEKGIAFNGHANMRKAFLKGLPFSLTKAQARVVREILDDMKRPVPMHRLLQGDVGCGKTVLALMAMLNAVECGYQAAFMAPTEILAEQHYLNLLRMTAGLGIQIGLLAGSTGAGDLGRIASGEVHIVVGTHALIQERVIFHSLGIAVIDEQHKFGVIQRSLLRKKGTSPDMLVMTATPIPRSLALTLYGDLDYSVVDELPPLRSRVITEICRSTSKNRIYGILEEEIRKGRQAFVVYPAVEESEKSDLKSAVLGKEGFEKVFPDFRIGLIHGRMSPSEREPVMSSFRKGEVDILVGTTVIEVGVDVPNATVMLIIHAERFGLSQLHQLRGRVGRGAERSRCLLVVYEPFGEDARRRLDIMVQSGDGFRLAEEDLAIRGPGEFFGTRQSGMPDLRFADIIKDGWLLEVARQEAISIIEADPDMEGFSSLRNAFEFFWRGKVDLFKTA